MCFFTRLKTGHPGPLKPPEDREGSWKVYHVCELADPRSSTTYADLAALEYKDKIQARETFEHLNNCAQTGLPLSSLFDEKQCHPAHAFTPEYQNHEEKIWRIRGGPIRVYFIYLPEKRIVILKTSAKRKDKLSEREKKELEALAKIVCTCVVTFGFEGRVI